MPLVINQYARRIVKRFVVVNHQKVHNRVKDEN